jgi:hypothetical protein
VYIRVSLAVITVGDAVPVIEPVPVADADPDADRAVASNSGKPPRFHKVGPVVNLRTVFPAAEQVLANACMAAFTFDPLHRLCICASTLVASPQTLDRSAGFGSVLR